jgi:hypothetical protein
MEPAAGRLAPPSRPVADLETPRALAIYPAAVRRAAMDVASAKEPKMAAVTCQPPVAAVGTQKVPVHGSGQVTGDTRSTQE